MSRPVRAGGAGAVLAEQLGGGREAAQGGGLLAVAQEQGAEPEVRRRRLGVRCRPRGARPRSPPRGRRAPPRPPPSADAPRRRAGRRAGPAGRARRPRRSGPGRPRHGRARAPGGRPAPARARSPEARGAGSGARTGAKRRRVSSRTPNVSPRLEQAPSDPGRESSGLRLASHPVSESAWPSRWIVAGAHVIGQVHQDVAADDHVRRAGEWVHCKVQRCERDHLADSLGNRVALGAVGAEGRRGPRGQSGAGPSRCTRRERAAPSAS